MDVALAAVKALSVRVSLSVRQEATDLTLGFTLLGQFRCVWNPRKKTILL